MVTDGTIKVDEILQTIQAAGGNIVLDVDLFDAIDFDDGTSSFAFHIILGADDRTLTSEEIDDVVSAITRALEEGLKVKVRR
jgi:phenylalanyl-tRNA synthetase beta chain